MNISITSKTLCLGLSLSLISTSNFAAKLNEQWNVSGWLRANIQSKSYSDDEHKLKFDAAKVLVNYKNDQWAGELEYRCYQFSEICDFSALVNAHLSYQFDHNSQHKLTLGLQDVPFGPARNWASSWYGGVLINMGLEDIHYVGLNYQFPLSQNTNVELAYFPMDGGRYIGESLDSARYSADPVKTSAKNDHDDLKSSNNFTARVKHHLEINDNQALTVGTSASYSDLKNKTSHQNGSIERWAAFGTYQYDALSVTLTAGQTTTSNTDSKLLNSTMIGSFDTAYPVANKGDFYNVDVYYQYPLNDEMKLSHYVGYSLFDKSDSSMHDSSRFIVGTQWDYSKFSIAAEYISGRSDYFIGGTHSAFSTGDHSHEKLYNLLFLYNF